MDNICTSFSLICFKQGYLAQQHGSGDVALKDLKYHLAIDGHKEGGRGFLYVKSHVDVKLVIETVLLHNLKKQQNRGTFHVYPK